MVDDGAIARRGGAYLWSTRQYGDFILDLECQVATVARPWDSRPVASAATKIYLKPLD